jgi:transposase
MPRTHPPYSPEFRRQIVDLVRTGRDPADLTREFEPTAQAIRNWVVQARRNAERLWTASAASILAKLDRLPASSV